MHHKDHRRFNQESLKVFTTESQIKQHFEKYTFNLFSLIVNTLHPILFKKGMYFQSVNI